MSLHVEAATVDGFPFAERPLLSIRSRAIQKRVMMFGRWGAVAWGLFAQGAGLAEASNNPFQTEQQQ